MDRFFYFDHDRKAGSGDIKYISLVDIKATIYILRRERKMRNTV